MTPEQEQAVSRRLDGLTLEQLGRALSHLNRFGGFGDPPCSVAWHSLSVYSLVLKRGGSKGVLLFALLHDAHECLCGDVLWSFKDVNLRQVEEVLRERLFKRLGVYGLMPDDKWGIAGEDAYSMSMTDLCDKDCGDAESYVCKINPAYDFHLNADAWVCVKSYATFDAETVARIWTWTVERLRKDLFREVGDGSHSTDNGCACGSGVLLRSAQCANRSFLSRLWASCVRLIFAGRRHIHGYSLPGGSQRP